MEDLPPLFHQPSVGFLPFHPFLQFASVSSINKAEFEQKCEQKCLPVAAIFPLPRSIPWQSSPALTAAPAPALSVCSDIANPLLEMSSSHPWEFGTQPPRPAPCGEVKSLGKDLTGSQDGTTWLPQLNPALSRNHHQKLNASPANPRVCPHPHPR